MTPEELAKAEIEAMLQAINVCDEVCGPTEHCGCRMIAERAHAAAAKVREDAGFYTLRILEDGEQHDPH